jgi:hypothetical protein
MQPLQIEPFRSHVLSHELRIVQAARTVLERALRDIELAVSYAATLRETDGCQCIDWRRIDGLMDQVRQEIFQGMPYGRCGCNRQKDCEICGGKSWISYQKYMETMRLLKER